MNWQVEGVMTRGVGTVGAGTPVAQVPAGARTPAEPAGSAAARLRRAATGKAL